ncbi:MAG: SDR family oxidoreductase [Alphaproteobacteria bacterium]|nr:SDR family oxidoreductase [Alphaproteobacteria bacterium]
MITLKGKTLLVTGGGRGIGAAIARAAVGLGGSVVVHDVSASALTAIGAELGASCHIVAGDLALADSVGAVWKAATDRAGAIDVLVNNAGIYEPADPGDDFAVWAASWRRTLAVNLEAPAHFCRKAIRHFQGRGGGIIVNMASRAAFRGDDPDYMHYAASKAGIVAMTRTIARGFGRDNITAFAVAPGFVRTNLNAAFFLRHGVDAATRDIPLGAVAEPEDIANVVMFLASGLARHATGTTIDVNGASYVR